MGQDREPEEPTTPDGGEREYHHPVMADEVVELFRPVVPGVVVDATFGGGGHTRRMVEEYGEKVRMVAIDKDPEAAAHTAGLPVTFVAGDFRDLAEHLDRLGIDRVHGVLFDFGVSSHQVDTAGRGFSFRQPGPLDMRMDPASPLTAEEIVNTWPVEEIARILADYGEEPAAARIARAVVAARPLHTTTELAEVVKAAIPAARRRRGGHPARRTFQALRIAVNDELEAIAQGLDAAIERLDVGGRCVAISYHSLEDRIVKRRFRRGARGCVCPPDLPVCGCGAEPELKILTPRPLAPQPQEIATNPRARSARLRAAEKVAA